MSNGTWISVVVIVVAILGLATIYGMNKGYVFDASKPVVYTEKSTFEDGIKIDVKGSIYESAEEMTLYGACFYINGSYLADANMTLSAWYPDGTSWINESNFTAMTEGGGLGAASTGRFYYKLNMSSTQGTYLTQATCHWGDYVAYTIGEWQNPTWVGRIKSTQDYLIVVNQSVYVVNTMISNLTNITLNVSAELTADIAAVKSDTENVLTYLGVLNTSMFDSGNNTDRLLNEVYNLVRDAVPMCWELDNTFYAENSSLILQGTSMAGTDDHLVNVVGNTGLWATFKGSTWNATNLTGYNWTDVDAIPGLDYVWAVGSNSSDPVFAVNKVYFDTINASNSTEFTDVEMAYSNGSVHVTLAGDAGDVWHYESGSFALYLVASGAGPTKISVLNHDAIFAVRGEYVYWKNGTNYASQRLVGEDIKDISVAYPDRAYLVSYNNATGDMSVYEYDGNMWTVDLIDGGGYIPTSMAVLNSEDIWVTTNTATIFFHYDGNSWDLMNTPYVDYRHDVIVYFENVTGSVANYTVGISDIEMLNAKQGYAVGDWGTIIRFCNPVEETYELVQGIDINVETLLNRSNKLKAWVQN